MRQRRLKGLGLSLKKTEQFVFRTRRGEVLLTIGFRKLCPGEGKMQMQINEAVTVSREPRPEHRDRFTAA